MPGPPTPHRRVDTTAIRRGIAASTLAVALLATSACSGSGDGTPAGNVTGGSAPTVTSPVPLVTASLPDGLGTVQLPEHLADLLGSSLDHTGAATPDPTTPDPAAPPPEPYVADLPAGLTVHNLHYARADPSSANTLPPERSTAIFLTIYDGEIAVDHVPAAAGPDGQLLEVDGLPAYLYTSRQGTGPVVTVVAWTPVPGRSVVLTGRGVETVVLRAVAESLRLS